MTASTQSSTFGSLLTQGWAGEIPTEKIEQAASESSTVKAAIVRPAIRIHEVPELLGPPPSLSEATPVSEATRVREAKKNGEAASAPSPTSFAELIKRRTAPPAVQERKTDLGAINFEFAPSVNRVDVERQIVANTEHLRNELASSSNVHAADPIQTEPVPVEAAAAAVVPEIATQVDAGSLSSIADATPPAVIDVPVRLDTVAAAETAPSESQWVEAKPPQTELPETVGSDPQLAATDALPSPDTSRPSGEAITAESHIGLPPLPDHASGDQIGLLPLKDVEDDSVARLGIERDQRSLTATIHATRLREIAHQALRNSKHRLQRGATYSAQKYALEALHAIVAMRDAQSGGNWHTQQLDVAFDAIRESQDLRGRFGAIDQDALKRRVAVHETSVLKDRDLEHITSLEATESYLAVARTHLVLAAGGVHEASDALVLLGQIEKLMSHPGDTHAAAVAVTLQRTALEIEPTNALGYRELGTTLLKQGLVEQAAWALNRSVEIQPTRSGYQRLLEASRRLGDIDTARVCLASLKKPEMQSEIPVRKLSTREFAATYRPNPESFGPVNAKKELKDAAKPKGDALRISLRSLFPFIRR